MPDKPNQAKKFSQAASQPRTGLLREVIHFLAHNKKWWLLPILVVLLLLGLLVMLGGTGVAPFLYTLF
jgi:hypothetical protein